jgi:hypothetical protein
MTGGAGGGASDTTQKITIASSSLTAAATTQAITLLTLPDNAEVRAVRIKPAIAFAAPSLTAMTVSVGAAGAGNETVYSPAFDIRQAVGNTVLWSDGGARAYSSVSHAVVATFASTGANLNTLTGGSVDIWVTYRVLP